VAALGTTGENAPRELLPAQLEVAVLDRTVAGRTFRRIVGSTLAALLVDPAAPVDPEALVDPEAPVGPAEDAGIEPGADASAEPEPDGEQQLPADGDT
jgi:hypothetical protein